MAALTWLHLSDWHQKGKEFNRNVVRDRLLEDIRERVKRISPQVEQVDFIVFSGDVAHKGKEIEYQEARKQLFNPLLTALDLEPGRLFIVPGNHDLDRDAFELLPAAVLEPFTSEIQIQEWLTNEKKRNRLLEPFEAYNQFVKPFANGKLSAYSSIQALDIEGNHIALLGINSAWMCGRNKDKKGEVDDYGKLAVGEPQVHDYLEHIKDAQVRIAVMHHPFDWLMEIDRSRIEERLGKACHFILCGHQHVSQVKVIKGTPGDCITIPAGSCYDRRTPDNPRYTNAYNFVHLDFETGKGTAYLRGWNDRQSQWQKDQGAHENGMINFELPKDLGKKVASTTVVPTIATSRQVSDKLQREKQVITAYLKALVRDHKDLDPRGIKQTKVQLVLPLEEIYVSLQADLDRPDVDRRVMQEDLEEIRQRLAQEEDPREREKQYQIWATQARVIGSTPGTTGKREKLHDIVRDYRQLTILGDPGSGKTTLLRYLTLKFAQEIIKDIDRFFASQEPGSDTGAWQIPGLGPVRLPIYMRIAKYADARNPKLGGNPNTALLDFLPGYFEGLNVPDARELGPIFRKLLEQGRCMVLLDGLDEIVEPTERRNIADAINRFVGAFREAGLPEWLSRWISIDSSRFPRFDNGDEEMETGEETTGMKILMDHGAPEALRQKLAHHLKNIRRRKEAGKPGEPRFHQLLRESGYIYMENRFVVTSRIAGYHFAPLAGEFEVFTIRAMDFDDIKLFLEKWCPAVERRMTDDPDPVKVKENAQKEINGILGSVKDIPGVRRMAANPLLLRILALVHRSEAHLPQRRVELYETAATTLLRDWNLQRELKITIDEKEALSLLGMVALWTHENRATGLITKGEVEEILGAVLAHRHGKISREEKDKRLSALSTGQHDPGFTTIPPDIEQAVERFLTAVREHSGLYVERGEGLYGFMHLTFQEYFAARQLVSSSERGREEILKRLHQPRWREPILLAVGSLSHQYYDDTDALLQVIIDNGKQDSYEPVLHRNLLFAAACVGDSISVYPRRREDIARRLMDIYIDRKGRGRYKSLQEQIKTALQSLCNEQGDEAVEQALAGILKTCPHPLQLKWALELVDFLKARTPAVLDALENCFQRYTIPGLHNTLYDMKQRMARMKEDKDAKTATGWQAHLNPGTARFMGVLWCYKWEEYLPGSLNLSESTVKQINELLQPLNTYRAVTSSRQLLNHIDKSSSQRDIEYWNIVSGWISDILLISPGNERHLLIAIYQLAWDLDKLTEGKNEIYLTLEDDIIESLSNLELKDEEIQEIAGTFEEAIAKFNGIIEIYEKKLWNYSPDIELEKAGRIILEEADGSQTLAPYFATTAKNFISLVPFPQEETLINALNEAIESFGNALPEVLKSTDDFQHYKEISLFLLFRTKLEFNFLFGIEDDFTKKVTSFLISELENSNEKRRRWSLQLLAEPWFHPYIQLSFHQHDLLIKMLDGPVDQALCALDILDLTPGFLSWCWDTLLQANHPLVDNVREKLQVMKNIPGTAPILDLLEQGTREPFLHSTALEMMLDIDWKGIQTFSYALRWLMDNKKELRHIGALLFAQQYNIFKEVEELIKDIPLENYKTMPVDELRKILNSPDDTHPLITWLEEQLASNGLSLRNLTGPENLRKLSNLLQNDDVNIRTAAALGTLSIDLHTLILKPMVEAALGENDRKRNVAFYKFLNFCEELPTDGSSLAVDELLKLRYRGRDDRDGYLRVTLYNAISRVQYTHLFYIKKWLETLSEPEADPEHRNIAQLGLCEVGKLAENGIRFLIEQAGNSKISQNVRKFMVSALWKIQRDPDRRWNEPWFNDSLCQLLRNSEPGLRKTIARFMQWSEGDDSLKVIQVLLEAARIEEDKTTRLYCIRSAGYALYAARLIHKKDESISAALTEIEGYLSDKDEEIRNAAACALACVYRDDEDRLSRLEEKVPGAETIMWASIESVSDGASYWKKDDYHEKTIKQLVDWLLAQPESKRFILIDKLLAEGNKLLLEATKEFNKYGTLTTVESILKYHSREHHIVICVLSELTEYMTYKGFTRKMSIEEVLDLFVLATRNISNWITRRGGIRALGNLQQFTGKVARAFFQACRDVDNVYSEANRAVGKFKYFDEESLAILTKAIEHPGIRIAYNAALLLGELGVSRSEELGAKGRQQVAEALLKILDTPAAERIVYDFTKNSRGTRIGLLYDVLYDSLVRVIAGPDSAAMIKEEEK
jgi:hypothetical protein